MTEQDRSGQTEPLLATPEQQALWQRLQAYRFGDDDDALPAFVRRVAKQAHCSAAQAQRMVEEYRRFCFLACTGTHDVTPSPLIDQVWHTHLTDTRAYWQQFCPQVLQTTLHHQPGRDGADEDARFQAQYRQTLERYRAHFGEPPALLWPAARQAPVAALSNAAHGDVAEAALRALRGEPKPRTRTSGIGTLLGWAAATLVVAAFGSTANGGVLLPLYWRGPSFLALFVLLIGLAWSAAALLRRCLRGSGSSERTCDAAEVAYLSGGDGRVADLYFAQLLSSDAVFLERDEDASGRVRVRCNPDATVPAALAPALRLVCQAEDPVVAWQALRSLAAPVRQRLIAKGLWLQHRTALRVRVVATLPIAAVWLVGAGKIVIGLRGGHPIGYLLALMVLVSMLLLGFVLVPARRTLAADQLLQARRSAMKPAAARTGSDPGDAVALYGSVALVGTPWASYHALRAPGSSGSESTGGSSCGGAGDSGGGDGGGDAGGGGGCGGCGGGGD
ncbi:hypothetical protein ASF73_10610 [Xanthomonas sp. Leaf131]|nr:hypothetical protein ASF73_10610 [Xanthomonas sp. Leaf131]